MGNHMSSAPARDATGKIVHWDGSVQEFHQPLSVAELMLEHPQQFVVEFHSAVTQKRPTPLPADRYLETNTMYLMLPVKRGKPLGLNAQDSRRFLLTVNSALHSKSLLPRSFRFLPWLARICHANTVGGAVIQKKEEILEEEKSTEERDDVFSEVMEGRPEYLSRELSGKGWKPSLDTITEKNIETKISHWLFFKAF